MKGLILILFLLVMPIVISELDVVMTMTTQRAPVHKPIYEDNPIFWIALIATVGTVYYYSRVFYRIYRNKKINLKQ